MKIKPKKIYKAQPYELRLETGIDLSDASVSTLQILYKKPGGTTGTFSGTILSGSKITHDVTSAENDESGDWEFQAAPVIDGVSTPGCTYTLKIWELYT